jgi:3-dehydroquinate synthase
VETADLFGADNPELLVLPDGQVSQQPRLVVVDDKIQQLYGQRINDYFAARAVDHQVVVLPGDEQSKTLDNALRIASALNAMGTPRRANPPIAIGGGVVLDVVGLAASLFRRGIPYIRVPTTLLGIVDVSVAAKTGVNYEGFRNRLGSYSPPPRTLIDKAFLVTLPDQHIRNGMGEILKMGAIKDRRLFELLECSADTLVAQRFQDHQDADDVICRSIQGMAEELADNLWERHLQRCVDYGHSFSPLIEMTALPELLHGEAVTLDCLFSAVLALHRDHLTEGEVLRLFRTAQKVGLPTHHHLFTDVAMLERALEDTTRHRNGNQHLPLMAGIGNAIFVNDVSSTELTKAAEAMPTFAADSANATAPEEAA